MRPNYLFGLFFYRDISALSQYVAALGRYVLSLSQNLLALGRNMAELGQKFPKKNVWAKFQTFSTILSRAKSL